MIPKYQRPALPVSNNWPGQTAAAVSSPAMTAAADVPWREFYTDPDLQAVIELALANNRDLRVAVLNVEKVRSYYRIQRSELLPSVGVQADGQKYRLPERMTTDGKASIVEQDTVQVGFVSWELDLFGRIRSLKRGALDQYLATRQARSATQISLVAAVAENYLVLAADRENLQLARRTLETQQASFDLIRKSRELGMASELDLRQAQSQVEATRGEVARYKGLVAVDRNALDLLAGVPVPTRLLPKRLDAVDNLRAITPGTPSDVLLRRPDILMNEYQLKAANANIGAARAAFFPRISLTAGLGSMSPELSGLFGSGTRTWSFEPRIVAPIFAGGSLRANVKATKLERDIAVANYEHAIQSAFREVADALTQRTTLLEREKAQRALVEALTKSYALSDARYKAGLDGYLNVLVSQRSLFAAQQGLVSVRLARFANRIELYKALGGGT